MQTSVFVNGGIIIILFLGMGFIGFTGIGVQSWVADSSNMLFSLPLMAALGLILVALMVGIAVTERSRYEAMRIGIGSDVLQRVFRTTTEEFSLHTFHRIRVVHQSSHHVRKI